MCGFIGIYGLEVIAVKRSGALATQLCEQLDLPEDALPGLAKLTLSGGRRALIENHKGILAYGPAYIAVAVKGGQLGLSGRDLRLLAMNSRELLIGGEIEQVEWSKAT